LRPLPRTRPRPPRGSRHCAPTATLPRTRTTDRAWRASSRNRRAGGKTFLASSPRRADYFASKGPGRGRQQDPRSARIVAAEPVSDRARGRLAPAYVPRRRLLRVLEVDGLDEAVQHAVVRGLLGGGRRREVACIRVGGPEVEEVAEAVRH